MPSRARCTGLIGAVVLFAAPVAAAQALVDVRLSGGHTEATVKAIARLGRPEPIRQRPGDSFEKVVLAKCGAIHPAYVEAFVAANGLPGGAAVASLATGQTYVYPACAQAPLSAPVKIRKGQTLETVLGAAGVDIDLTTIDVTTTLRSASPAIAARDFQSIAGPWAAATGSASRGRAVRAFTAKANAVALAALNPDVAPRGMLPGDEVKVLQQEPTWTTIPLQPGVTAEQAKAELATAIQQDRSPSQVSDVIPATLISGIGGFGAGACPAMDRTWPYSIDGLKTVIDENARARPAGVFRTPVTVLVLDTGYDSERMTGAAIPENRITRLLAPIAPSFERNNIGVNLATNELTAMPPADLDNRFHGSEVAVVVLGDRLALTTPELQGLPVQIAFASVAAPTDAGPVLSARAVQSAIRYASRNNIKIINISLMATADREAFASALQANGGDILIVAAAGNDHREYGVVPPTWPGGHGGDPGHAVGGNVITVGSHDRNGALSPFSRFGENFVDLLAPGCAVPTYTAGGDGEPPIVPVEREGTSYSAPLVSNVAAQLIAEGFETPFVKARVLASVDVDEALDGSVYSRGRLNVRKALSVWRDLVEYHEGGVGGPVVIRTGAVERAGKVVKPCGTALEVKRLMKLSFTQPDPNGDKHAHVWLKSDDPSDPTRFTRRSLCRTVDLAEQKLAFRDAETGAAIDIPLAQLVDFVPRAADPQ